MFVVGKSPWLIKDFKMFSKKVYLLIFLYDANTVPQVVTHVVVQVVTQVVTHVVPQVVVQVVVQVVTQVVTHVVTQVVPQVVPQVVTSKFDMFTSSKKVGTAEKAC